MSLLSHHDVCAQDYGPTIISTMDDEFNFRDADLILRSGDGVEFAVHRQILRLISAVFEAMLSLPTSPGYDMSVCRQVVQMTEDAHSLRLLLQFCYPRPVCKEPELLTILDIKCAAFIAEKYDLDFLREKAEKALTLYKSPAHVFAVAWRYGYEKTARAAARQSLEVPNFFRFVVGSGDILEFDEVPATAFIHLYRYRSEAESQLQRILRTTHEYPITWITPSSVNAQFLIMGELDIEPLCSCCSTLVWFHENGEQAARQWRVYSWWWGYVCTVVHSLCSENKPYGLEEILNDTLLDYTRSVLHCTSCDGDAAQVLEHTRRNLCQEMEDQLRTISLPLRMVLKDSNSRD